jgi:hypothetical protein
MQIIATTIPHPHPLPEITVRLSPAEALAVLVAVGTVSYASLQVESESSYYSTFRGRLTSPPITYDQYSNLYQDLKEALK